MNASDAGAREMLRHTVATLAYRGGKAMRGAPPEFATFDPGEGVRPPGEILAHLSDLLDWARGLCDGQRVWPDAEALAWEDGVARFFSRLETLDARLADAEPLGYPPQRLFQGPIADALTHVGQIAMLRRIAGCPVRGENYFKADITVGRVGADQAASRVEFD
jgi:hypothetical protein